MSNSVPSIRPGALWAHHDERQEHRHSLGVAIIAALLIEAALLMGVSHVDFSQPAPKSRPVMRVRLAVPEVPPPPPVIHKIIKQTPMVKPKLEKPKPQPARKPIIRKIVKERQARPMVEKPAAKPVTRHHAERKVAPQPVAPLAAAEHPARSAPAVASPAPVEKAAPATAPIAAPSGPVEIGIACPTQLKPEMPAKALAEGIEGNVVARAQISGGRVISVQIISANPPGVFDAAVRHAMMGYKCENNTDSVVTAEQTFNFAVDN